MIAAYMKKDFKNSLIIYVNANNATKKNCMKMSFRVPEN